MSSTNFSLASKVMLPNGRLIPQIQLGLYMVSGSEATTSIRYALTAGYRGFDSAQWYYNEKEAGRAIRVFLDNPDLNTQRLSRSDIFFTTKLKDNSTSYESMQRSIQKSLTACGLGYIDLLLLHSPYGGREARLTSWKAIEDAIDKGLVKSGGVSNFGVRHIEELIASKPRIAPVVNQIEVHPFNTQTDIRAVCAKYGIVVEAYAPLARRMRMKHPTILELSEKYSCSPTQLMIRWSLQHGLIPLPKSTKNNHIIENADIGGFEISDLDMEKMNGLDEKLVTDWDPTDAP